jgi:hypothetical protein
VQLSFANFSNAGAVNVNQFFALFWEFRLSAANFYPFEANDDDIGALGQGKGSDIPK